MYVRFRSKQDVLYQVMRIGQASALEAVEEALTGDAPPDAKVRWFVEAFTSWHAQNHSAARVRQYDLRALKPERFDEIREVRGRFDLLLKEELRRGVDSGLFAIPKVDYAALAILSLGIDVARWYHPSVGVTPEELGKQYAELVLRMLGSEENSARDAADPRAG